MAGNALTATATLQCPHGGTVIIVSANASGTVQPDTTVEVKTRASGEVLEMRVETGQKVQRGTLLLRIDPRQLRNAVAQAQADLQAAQAQQTTTSAQQKRAEELFQGGAITAQDLENVQLASANARAAVVRARVALENARIQLEDTDVRAPISGTIIEKGIERGSVIASATQNVGGGTTLLKMADLDLVQVTSQVDETDIGKVEKGQSATVTVDAYPNRPFDGTVLKIEPQAVVINLGTNDISNGKGDPGDAFRDTYAALLQTVRASYPHAYIVGIIAPLLSGGELATIQGHIRAAVQLRNDAGDSNVEFFDQIPPQTSDKAACQYHPNVAENMLMADMLVPVLRAKLGW